MLLPILFEPNYKSSSIWCSQIQNGIEKTVIQKKYSPTLIDEEHYTEFDYDSFFSSSPRVLMIVASSPSWIYSALNFFARKNIFVLLIDSWATHHSAKSIVKGSVCFDYDDCIRMMLDHLEDCGCSKTALYGVFGNSSADRIKYAAFETEMLERGYEDIRQLCFDNNSGLVNCYDSFRERISEFDSVLCVNDVAACSLIIRLKEDGIKVPEDLQVISFGGSQKLAETMSPSITTVELDNMVVGQQAILAYKYLAQNFENASISVRVPGLLIARESTSLIIGQGEEAYNGARQRSASRPLPSGSFYDDDEVTVFSRFETLLLSCDKFDRQILKHLLNHVPYEKISDMLNMSRSTVFYRLQRILKKLDIESYDELRTFLQCHRLDEILKK